MCINPKVYISGKITGCEDTAQEVFSKYENILKEKGYTPLNPYKVVCSGMPDTLEHREYMHVAFALLDLADYIFMIPGWETSCGASQEYGYAKAKGVTELKL